MVKREKLILQKIIIIYWISRKLYQWIQVSLMTILLCVYISVKYMIVLDPEVKVASLDD